MQAATAGLDPAGQTGDIRIHPKVQENNLRGKNPDEKLRYQLQRTLKLNHAEMYVQKTPQPELNDQVRYRRYPDYVVGYDISNPPPGVKVDYKRE